MTWPAESEAWRFDPTGIFDDVWLGVLRDKERLYIIEP